MKTGSADLPLHGGHCPPRLFEDMKDLAGVMLEAMVLEFESREIVRRFADPGWFQSFGCTLGFDWHSSGLTTVVCGALKEALNPRADELGLFLAGGKGATSRKTPRELAEYAENSVPSLPVTKLQRSSRQVAQVDSAALQDGFDLYHHTFLVSEESDWTVIQQGIHDESNLARRYHWWSGSAGNFFDNPHEGIRTDKLSDALNLSDTDSRENRGVTLEMVQEDPVGTLREFTRLLNFWDETRQRLKLPDRHSLPKQSHLDRSLGRLYENPPANFSALLDTDEVGRKTVRALSMVAEVVWGAEPSYEDPARYAFAHGGKDGHPRPVDRQRYRQSIDVLSDAIRRSKVGDETKMKAFRRLKFSFSSNYHSMKDHLQRDSTEQTDSEKSQSTKRTEPRSDQYRLNLTD